MVQLILRDGFGHFRKPECSLERNAVVVLAFLSKRKVYVRKHVILSECGIKPTSLDSSLCYLRKRRLVGFFGSGHKSYWGVR